MQLPLIQMYPHRTAAVELPNDRDLHVLPVPDWLRECVVIDDHAIRIVDHEKDSSVAIAILCDVRSDILADLASASLFPYVLELDPKAEPLH